MFTSNIVMPCATMQERDGSAPSMGTPGPGPQGPMPSMPPQPLPLGVPPGGPPVHMGQFRYVLYRQWFEKSVKS